ncbi:MAG: ATP-dependent Clp protease ATP-binding subunit [Planctomycetaceae bacterium]|nr:ATP-dependent Clp protease ATP-binding subunit [Planctomycetaceae bacterium]
MSTTTGKPPDYVVRPLFFSSPETNSQFLQSALNKLTHRLREMFVELGKDQRHDALAAWTYCPEVETKRCEVRIEVAKQSARLKLLLVMMQQFDRRIAFTPAFPELWFEILKDQIPADRLAESITEYLKTSYGQSGDGRVLNLERYSLKGNAWVSEIEFRIKPPRVRKKKADNLFAFLGASETVDGESELYRVGRCLNHLYPQDLNRVMLRDHEVDELSRLLTGDDRRPVLLLGPRQVGKTAILHEYVFQLVRKVGNPHRDKQAVWLLSPQRLISGMSYVGQWETRFHAITKHAALRDLALYFDDLLGLFQAGVTSQSTLNVAALLKTVLERRQVRIVAEMTPEAFRILREKDRGFADAFHVIRLDEMSSDDNLRVLFSQQRQLEIRHRCRFAIDALPAVIDLQRRYNRNVAFPGKAAAFLKRLAVKLEGEFSSAESTRNEKPQPSLVTRDRVLDAFHQQSGLPQSFLDQHQTLAADDITRKLRERFIGQPDAVSAAVEIISIARARLNDPTRPIASLLLLGPTGVGKTEFAKSLASYLFGNSERLLRFDMNEYVSSNAVPQLVGTFAQPEGLLTAAVRRQPFAVVLFDEIEKGHPDVFDLLLQVLGEGRLTDARGRTTDFSNTIIVLTSNLGTQRSEAGLGFGASAGRDASASVRAAENFFRPEFFNRLDRVIPFDRLSREDMQGIARHLMSDVLHRDGLIRRQCVLNTSSSAVDWVIDQGYNPVLGARALKRAIEKELTRPIAAFLAANSIDLQASTVSDAGLLLIDIERAERGLSVAVRALRDRPSSPAISAETHTDISTALQRCRHSLNSLTEMLPALKVDGGFETRMLSPTQTRYLLVQDEVPRLKAWLDELQSAQMAMRQQGTMGIVRQSGRTSPLRPDFIRRRGPSHGNIINRAAADDEIHDYLETRFDGPIRDVNLVEETPRLLARIQWVQAVASAPVERLDESVTLHIQALDPTMTNIVELLTQRLQETWNDELGLETTVESVAGKHHFRIIHVKGVLATHYSLVECGFHAVLSSSAPSPKIILVQRHNEPIEEVIVRKVTIDAANPARTFPSIEELQHAAWSELAQIQKQW